MQCLRGWKWAHEGVDLYDDHLLWYEELGPVAFASGGAAEQTFEEFLRDGPRASQVPADVIAELTAAVNDRIAGRK